MRVIGLPGEEVEIRDKKVFINGRLLQEPYIVPTDPINRGFPRDVYGPIKVPPGSVFVLGDNRDTCKDSRYWEFVPVENIIREVQGSDSFEE